MCWDRHCIFLVLFGYCMDLHKNQKLNVFFRLESMSFIVYALNKTIFSEFIYLRLICDFGGEANCWWMIVQWFQQNMWQTATNRAQFYKKDIFYRGPNRIETILRKKNKTQKKLKTNFSPCIHNMVTRITLSLVYQFNFIVESLMRPSSHFKSNTLWFFFLLLFNYLNRINELKIVFDIFSPTIAR